MRAHGRRYLSKDAALRYMQSLSHRYSMQVTVRDTAVAEGGLACFTHWQAVLTPRWREGGGSGNSMASSSQSSLASIESEGAAVAAAAAAVDNKQSTSSASSRGQLSHQSSHLTQVQEKQQAEFKAASRRQQQQQDRRQERAAAAAAAAAASAAAAAPDATMSPAAAAADAAADAAAAAALAADTLVVDGLGLVLFNAELLLKVIWVFRGPVSSTEEQLFLEYDRRQAAAEAARVVSDQELVRAARRAQREQQVRVRARVVCGLGLCLSRTG
jgi:hypothetical protein